MSKFPNKNWLVVFLFLVFAATAGLFFADQVRAALTCSVVSSCADVTLLKMYATTNSHAGLPASSAYTNLVCCADVTAGLSNNCSGTYAPVGTLSGTNNAHYEDWTKTNYSSPANDFCLSVTSGTITVSTSTNCGSDTTVFSFSGTSGTNAHVGDANAYATKICATTTAAPTVSCDTNITSTSFGPLTTGSVTTASPNASTTMSCTYSGGCTLSVSDVGAGANQPGLATSSPVYLIPSPNAAYDPTAVLAINTEGYGITATTTTGGSGGSLAIYSRYDVDSGGTRVGGLKTGGFGLTSSTGPITNRQLIIKHKAAISFLTNVAKYEDTLTYSCTGN